MYSSSIRTLHTATLLNESNNDALVHALGISAHLRNHGLNASPTPSYAISVIQQWSTMLCTSLNEYKLYSTFLKQSAIFSCEALPHEAHNETTLV